MKKIILAVSMAAITTLSAIDTNLENNLNKERKYPHTNDRIYYLSALKDERAVSFVYDIENDKCESSHDYFKGISSTKELLNSLVKNMQWYEEMLYEGEDLNYKHRYTRFYVANSNVNFTFFFNLEYCEEWKGSK